MCDKSAFRGVEPEVKTAEQLYKEWWQKQQEKEKEDDAGTEKDDNQLR